MVSPFVRRCRGDTNLRFCRHWPIGLLYDCNTVSQGLHSVVPTAPNSSAPTQPLRLTLHLTAPPTDKLLLSPSVETCKLSYMGQLKETDFLRWGNTKRVTGLRKQDHDGLWEGVRTRKSRFCRFKNAGC